METVHEKESGEIQPTSPPGTLPTMIATTNHYPAATGSLACQWTVPSTHRDVFYPGIYCPSGFDIMKVLFYVAARPNPQIYLGPVDTSCSFVVCDLQLPDTPVVYVSDPFLLLTGYTREEVVGRNCRFLQTPPSYSPARDTSQVAPPKPLIDNHIRSFIRQVVEYNIEAQVQVANYRKDGTGFYNLLTLIPIPWDEDVSAQNSSDSSPPQRTHRYCVGFQCNLGNIQ